MAFKENIQFKAKLLKQLNSNLNFLLENPEEEKIEQLIERLALISQCIDQTLLLILLEAQAVKQTYH